MQREAHPTRGHQNHHHQKNPEHIQIEDTETPSDSITRRTRSRSRAGQGSESARNHQQTHGSSEQNTSQLEVNFNGQ